MKEDSDQVIEHGNWSFGHSGISPELKMCKRILQWRYWTYWEWEIRLRSVKLSEPQEKLHNVSIIVTLGNTQRLYCRILPKTQ